MPRAATIESISLCSECRRLRQDYLDLTLDYFDLRAKVRVAAASHNEDALVTFTREMDIVAFARLDAQAALQNHNATAHPAVASARA